ncbi:hypothetical protein B0H34DRAFT_737089 [Crassisporium funariophilum]|nr:hypothetical protein B0H34DRAFT_737089 [Crassisporium funariophilum]
MLLSPVPGSFPSPPLPPTSPLPSPPTSSSTPTPTPATTATLTTPAPSLLSTASISALTALLASSARSSSSSSSSSSSRGTWGAPDVRSPLDIALAMQLRPGLGVGADPAWMVRFLMAFFGWFAVLVSGQGDY